MGACRLIIFLKVLICMGVLGQESSTLEQESATPTYVATTLDFATTSSELITTSTSPSTPIVQNTTTYNLLTTSSLSSTTSYNFVCASYQPLNISHVNDSIVLVPTDHGNYLPNQNCTWQISVTYPSAQHVLQLGVYRYLSWPDQLIVTNCQNTSITLIEDYEFTGSEYIIGQDNTYYTQETQLCVNFVSSPNDTLGNLQQNGYNWKITMYFTDAPIVQSINLTSNDPIKAVSSTYSPYTQLTINASTQSIELRIYYNSDFTPSPPSNYLFIYESSNLINYIGLYSNDISTSPLIMTIFSESITLLFSKEFTPSRSLQIVARIPEIHGQNCENTNNLLAAYPVDENISYEFAANSKGACVFTILVPYTQETHVGSNSTITPTTVAPILQTLPALSFDNINTNTNENVEVVFGYNQDFPAFVFNQDGNSEWDGVVVYGNLISVIIPENGTVGVNVTTLKEPPSTSTSINGKKKGIISSSDYPKNSIFQNTTKSIGCENGVIYGLFNLTIVYADIPDDCNFYLGAYVGQTPMGTIPISNQTVINETNIIYNVTFISIIYTTGSTPNQGFLITYEVNCEDTTGGPTSPTHSVIPNSTSTIQATTTTPKSKDHDYIWIIISLVILFLFVALLGAFLYIWFKRKHERKMTKFLEIRLESQRRRTQSIHENAVSKHNNDPYFLNEAFLKINYERPIGKGSSSIVYRGQLNGPSPISLIHKSLETKRYQNCDVAVKVATFFGFDEVDQLYREIDVMKQIGYHKHITSMLGWYLKGETPCLVFELADRDFLSYLRSLNEKPDEVAPFKEHLSILWQISRGMQYIASLRLVHRDLAARNILLTNTNIAKLSDFGLCCTCDDSFTYQASIHKKLPMKWLSLEAINDRRFSEKSDVWSFGILMYEVFSRGKVPYTNMTISEMLDFLKSGQRLECPRDANDEIYEIMRLCWELEPDMRPKFEELDQVFREILEKETEVYGYLT